MDNKLHTIQICEEIFNEFTKDNVNIPDEFVLFYFDLALSIALQIQGKE